MIQRLVLLPGMDGTGELFADFVKALPDKFETESVRYPTDVFLSYSELIPLVRSSCPPSEPFVLLAESFSTPLAIQFAAMNPPNLRGLVLCAGFATSPVRGLLHYLSLLLSPVFFKIPLPKFVARVLLVGPTAPPSLLAAVLASVSSVGLEVLSARFRAVLSCDARIGLGRVTVPILYVQAQQDRLIHASCLKEICRIKPLTIVATIDGPHLILQREPQQAAKIVERFVQQLM